MIVPKFDGSARDRGINLTRVGLYQPFGVVEDAGGLRYFYPNRGFSFPYAIMSSDDSKYFNKILSQLTGNEKMILHFNMRPL